MVPGQPEPQSQVSNGDELGRQIGDARGGCPYALGSLLESFRNYLLLIANQEVPDEIRPKIAPSDLVQQSMAEAWQAFEFFRGDSESDIKGWLRRILLNNLTDTTRAFRQTNKRGGAGEVSLGSVAGTSGLIAPDPSPSGCALAEESMRRLAAALEELPNQYATIIRLRNLEYRSFPEIGGHMHISAGAARKLWERAVRRLAAELNATDD